MTAEIQEFAQRDPSTLVRAWLSTARDVPTDVARAIAAVCADSDAARMLRVPADHVAARAAANEALALDAKATPGEWFHDDHPRGLSGGSVSCEVPSYGRRQVAASIGQAVSLDDRVDPSNALRNNASLIARYRTLAPQLARDVLRLSADFARLDADNKRMALALQGTKTTLIDALTTELVNAYYCTPQNDARVRRAVAAIQDFVNGGADAK